MVRSRSRQCGDEIEELGTRCRPLPVTRDRRLPGVSLGIVATMKLVPRLHAQKRKLGRITTKTASRQLLPAVFKSAAFLPRYVEEA